MLRGVEIKAGASCVTIHCQECGQEIEHECQSHAEHAARLLRSFVAEKGSGAAKAVRDSALAVDGDDEQPLFSEAVLYPLLGKCDARAVLEALDTVLRAVGSK